MRRIASNITTVVVPALALLFFAGCPEDEPQPGIDIHFIDTADTGGGTEVTGDADAVQPDGDQPDGEVPDGEEPDGEEPDGDDLGIDAPEVELPDTMEVDEGDAGDGEPPKPELKCEVSLYDPALEADQWIAFGPPEQIPVAWAQEPSAYGHGDKVFETDIRVVGTALGPDHSVELTLNGVAQSAELDAGEHATFQGLVLKVGENEVDVVVLGTEVSCETTTLTLAELPPPPKCEATIAPLKPEGKCWEGDTVDFTVTLAAGGCDQAFLTYSLGADTLETEPVAIAEGSAQISLNVAGLDGVQIQVTGHVKDSAGEAEPATTSAVSFVVDDVPPTVQITSPVATALAAGDDADKEKPGFQVNVSGKSAASSAGGGKTVVVTGCDAEALPAALDASGDWTVQIECADGSHEITAVATDGCGLTSVEAAIVLQVSSKPVVLEVVAPAGGSTLLAKDDGDKGTPNEYEIPFTVKVDPAPVFFPYTLTVLCGGVVGAKTVAGTKTFVAAEPSGLYEIPDVVLDQGGVGAGQVCVAKDNALNPATSPQIGLTVGLPAPMLKILSPIDGTLVGAVAVTVNGTAQHLNWNTTGTLELLDAGMVPVYSGLPWPANPVNDGFNWTAYLTKTGKVGGAALDDGAYTIRLSMTDKYGNKACDNEESTCQVMVVLDRAAPVLTIDSPPGDVFLDADDANPVMPGFQQDVGVSVADGGNEAGVKVCLSVSGTLFACQDVAAGSTAVLFEDVTLQPGENVLGAVGTDVAGNVSSPAATRTLTLDSESPSVVITNPAGKTSTAFSTIDVTVKVTDSDGGPVDGALVSVLLDGAAASSAGVKALGGGMYLVEGVFLGAPGLHQVVAQAQTAGGTGVSLPVTVHFKEDEPTISIDTLADGAFLNKASPQCTPGKTACEISIKCVTAAVDDLSSAKLTYDCGAGPVVLEAGFIVFGGSVTFPGVTLANGATCALTCGVTDKGTGKVAVSLPVSVTVDRTAPKLTLLQPVKTLLTFVDDLEPGGLLDLVPLIQASGMEAGQKVTVSFQPDPVGGDPPPVALTQSVADGKVLTLSFAKVSLDAGAYTLTATGSDKAENPAPAVKLTFQVTLAEPFIRISTPAFIDPKACTSSAGCSGGMCVQGKCARAWSKSSARAILTISEKTMPDLTNNVRICSDHASYAGMPACTASGAAYRQVAVSTMTGSQKDIDVSVAADGLHTFVAERKTSDSTWVSSTDQPEPPEQFRRIWIDTVLPVVTQLALPGDSAPLGCLGAKDTRDVSVTCDSEGTVELFLADVSVGKKAATAGAAVTYPNVAFLQGDNSLEAVCADAVGNLSVASKVTVKLDTSAPKLTFAKPAKPVLVAGDSLDVEILSDSPGQEVCLLSTLKGNIGCAAVSPGGKVTFPGALADGKQLLTATATDACGNAAVLQSPEITVDTSPPSIVLFEPAPEVSLVDADDADSGSGGFQVTVRVATADDASTWRLTLEAGCNASFAGCGAPVELHAGDVENPGDEEPALVVTLPVVKAPDYLILRATAKDVAGNEASVASFVTITLSACSASIVGLPATSINNDLCPVAGADCDSVDLSFEVQFFGVCPGLVTAELFDGATKLAQAAVTDGFAAFTQAFAHGKSLALSAKAGGLSTGVQNLKVDLKDPVPLFTAKAFGADYTSPKSGAEAVFNVASDRNLAPGLQVHLHLQISDSGLGGGQILSLTLGDGSDVKGSPALPVTVAGTAFEQDFLNVSLPEGMDKTLTANVRDAAGNLASTSFDVDVDSVPPMPVGLKIQGFNRRRPAVTLSWEAPGDDTWEGGPAAEYDIRYSRSPIDKSNWELSCDAANLLTAAANPIPQPGQPLGAETYTITGPDARGPYQENGNNCQLVVRTKPGAIYYFGVRARDDLGNWSDIGASSVVSTTELGFRYAKFSVVGAMANIDFERFAYAIGDINNDEYGDFAVGGGATGKLCIFYGSQQATVPNVAIEPDKAAEGTGYQCMLNKPARFGFQARNIGDVNGDGLQDLGVPSGYQTTPPTPRQIHVFLGVDGGKISTTEALVIKGYVETQLQGKFSGNGNFDGNVSASGYPIHDIIVGSRHENTSAGRSYLVPGSAAWPKAVLDLSIGADRTAFKVQTIELKENLAATEFGGYQDFVGDILPDVGASYDDVVVSAFAAAGTTRAYVLKGRPISAAGTLQMSFAHDGSAPEDANSVLILPDAGNDQFASDAITRHDVDGDGIPDLFLEHSKNQGYNMLYMFRGAAIQASIGGTLKLGTAANVSGVEKQLVTDDGVVWSGDKTTSYARYFALGNIADDPDTGPADLTAIGYGRYSSTAAGTAYIRLNHADPEMEIEHGTYPYVDMAVQDPFEPQGTKFGFRDVLGVGDFNGDGLPDILVGTNGAGYVLLMY